MSAPKTFHSLYDVPCSDLGAVADQLLVTNDPEVLRRYAVGLWLDVYLLQLSIGVIRARYAELVAAAERAVATGAGPDLGALRRHLELAVDDPDIPVGYALTQRASHALEADNWRPR